VVDEEEQQRRERKRVVGKSEGVAVCCSVWCSATNNNGLSEMACVLQCVTVLSCVLQCCSVCCSATNRKGLSTMECALQCCSVCCSFTVCVAALERKRAIKNGLRV